jgi:hypothetical protein
MNREEARLRAIKLATEKGWKEDDVTILLKEGDDFVFNLYMPKEGDFGAPCCIIVNDVVCEIRDLTLQQLLLVSNKVSNKHLEWI